ncbi:hypothetical protein JCM11641_002769 [Rhodosporidiobolus odoratus]
MVPQPVWTERPGHPLMNADPTVCTDSDAPLPELPTDCTNVSGRWWKPVEAKAKSRKLGGAQDKLKLDKKWKEREEQRKKQESIKKLEKEIKADKLAEAERKREITKERKEKEAEKERLQQMAARMSAKKLQRMKKRMGRSKKVAQ